MHVAFAGRLSSISHLDDAVQEHCRDRFLRGCMHSRRAWLATSSWHTYTIGVNACHAKGTNTGVWLLFSLIYAATEAQPGVGLVQV